MRWTSGGPSKNLEDGRGESGGGGGGFGGGGGRRIGLGGLVVLVVLSLVFKRDFVSDAVGLGDGTGMGPPSQSPPRARPPVSSVKEDSLVLFMSSVLDSVQTQWHRTLPGYTDAKLRLFRDEVLSACGQAAAASGPFYCPGDQKVYLDLGFFDQLERQFGAPGDFAEAYVLAHEIGHHVQNLVGTERKMRAAQQQNPGFENRLSVAMELQADCYAGVWGHFAAQAGQLDPGDLDEGLGAASAVGDDRLQKMSSGRVNRDSFTHGSAADRRAWFKRGFDSGDMKQCDTFAQLR